jgi:hypothetical protein
MREGMRAGQELWKTKCWTKWNLPGKNGCQDIRQ